jgi:serine/threonine protein kinase
VTAASAHDDARSGAAVRVGGVLGGKYRILRRIGSGGMADVYEVEHLRLASSFAAKVLREHRQDSVRRFLREARLLAQLKSDHIVTVFDVGDPNEEAPFYVMELLSGSDLRQLLAATPELSIGRAVRIISDACRGIGVAHAAGLVHRDLKPDNLFVTHRDSGEEVAKLLDFGVAKADEGTSTEHGALIGTVRYMAPEQIEHSGVVSTRADVRGLGAILYECLAGRPPHVADSIERLLFKVLNDRVEPVRNHRPDVPAELDDVILRALERDPGKRFACAADFAEALRPFRDAGGASIDATIAERAPLQKRTPRPHSRLAIALAAGGIAVGAGVLMLGKPPTPVADAAEQNGKRPPATAAATVAVRAPQASVAEPPGPKVAKAVEEPSPSSVPSASTARSRSARQLPRSVGSAKTAAPARAPNQTPAPAPDAPMVKIDSQNPYGP